MPLDATTTLSIETRRYDSEGALELVDDGVATIGEVMQHLAVSNRPILAVTWQISPIGQTDVVAGFAASINGGAAAAVACRAR